MAVYTHVSAESMADLLSRYDVGTLVSAKGIAEGVENSNYMVETTTGRYFLTLYEKRVDAADLPFFLKLLDHVADHGNPVPRAINAVDGSQIQTVAGRPACLIEFLTGVSVSHPTSAQAESVGHALGKLHAGLSDFPLNRHNTLGPDAWYRLADQCGENLDQIQPGLQQRVNEECIFLQTNWPSELPRAIVHGDLFPDNVLIRGNHVTGLIDFYFACTEIRAWDLAVTHAAWSFDEDGSQYHEAIGDTLVTGYRTSFDLSAQEYDAFNILARGACLRFLLTRAWDWLNTPSDALVTRKDPLAFLRRLEHYASR